MRKYKGSYRGKDSYKERIELRVFKHTERRPMSDWHIFLDPPAYGNKYSFNPTIVQDIKRGLENPLNVDPIFGYDNSGRLVEIPKRYHMCSPDKCYERKWGELVNTCGYPKQQKGDWKEWHEDMKRSVKEQEEFYEKHKSLLERITNKLRRKDNGK